MVVLIGDAGLGCVLGVVEVCVCVCVCVCGVELGVGCWSGRHCVVDEVRVFGPACATSRIKRKT